MAVKKGRQEDFTKSIADFSSSFFVFICRSGRRFLQAERRLWSQEHLGRRLADVYLGIGVVWCCAAHGGTVRLSAPVRLLRCGYSPQLADQPLNLQHRW